MKRCAALFGFLAFIGLSMVMSAAATGQDNAAEAAPPAAVEAAPPAASAPPAGAESAPPDAVENAPVTVEVREVGAAAAYPDGLVHTVVEGDTLWDLSAKYLGTPWRWPELWAQNRFLTNPHFIYPGIKVVIFPPPPKSYALPGEAAVQKAAEPEAEGLGQRGLARAHGAADADLEWSGNHDRNSLPSRSA